MTRKTNSIRNDVSSQFLNIGCGRRYHPDWTNLDLETNDPNVIRHDIVKGVPFDESNFEVVYHSHVLEHLHPDQGRKLIEECFRVLVPGGVLRVVVPDLERIAQLYLETHQRAWSGDIASSVDYNWMKLELLDQMVRGESGGRMGKYMANGEIKNSEFVRSRVGDEFSVCRAQPDTEPRIQSFGEKLAKLTFGWRRQLACRVVRWMLGQRAMSAFEEGLFRSQGEIHRWMYDRYSLRDLCQNAGFVNFQVCRADESRIEGYPVFELDAVDGQARKPDSIFVECEKPTACAAKAA